MGAGGSFNSVKAIGFAVEDEARLYSVTRRPNGLFLVTGPTGSGKSTTLGSIISTMYLAQPDRAYYSIEHPVEVEHNGIWQIPIKGNLTFEEALESCMRNDPDVILVGEIRSQKTAELAIQAALTGHVVLATLHTNDAHGVIPRLKHFGVTSVDLAECLIGSCAQRLVPTLCKHCCEKRPLAKLKPRCVQACLLLIRYFQSGSQMITRLVFEKTVVVSAAVAVAFTGVLQFSKAFYRMGKLEKSC